MNLILDKNFLINKIYDLKEEKLGTNYISFKILENDNEFNILFDNKTFDLLGWQTKDIYQNISVTNLFSIRLNQQVRNDLFNLPTQN